MKRLNELFDTDNDMKIYSIHSDSRYVKPYSIFFCIEGLSVDGHRYVCLLYTSPSPRDISGSRMPSSA